MIASLSRNRSRHKLMPTQQHPKKSTATAVLLYCKTVLDTRFSSSWWKCGDLPISDCYRRSIACSRKGFTRHCRDAILPKSHNHRTENKRKTVLDTRFSSFWWKCGDLPISDCYRRSIACSRKGFTRHCRDAILPKSHNHRTENKRKTVLDTRFSSFWWKCGDLPISDCYRRSIACSRKGFTRHCRDAIL